MNTYQTRHTLLERIRDPHDADAWQEFMEFYQGYIYTIIRSMNIKPHDAEDILQQINIKLWKNLPDHMHLSEKGRFRAWVATVSKNTVISFIKKQQTRITKLEHYKKEDALHYLNSIKLPEIDNIAQKEWEVFLSNSALENISSKFTAQAIQAFELHIEGIGTAEIAKKIKVSRDSVYKYISRVKLRFIDEINYLKNELDF